MITIEDFIQKTKEALEIKDEEILPQTRIREVANWNSMNALILMAMFETEFDKTLTGDDLKNCITVEDLYQVVIK